MEQADARCFEPVYVNPVVGVQSPANRFGSGSSQHATHPPPSSIVSESLTEESEQGSDSEDEDGEDDIIAWPFGDGVDLEARVGSMRGSVRFARFRTNLTVLSQVYNLYFVAYMGTIHVYRPENAPQVLRKFPLLCLKTVPSPVAALTRGHISMSMPHQINHMITGMFGDSEVLLAAFDDGDVIGYYTHQIAEAIEHSVRRSSGKNATVAQPPEPFFRSAVGKSAWGLAVHAKSRLIAVSSNTHEVTVFAPALTEGSVVEERIPPDHERCNPPKLGGLGLDAQQLESHLRQRTREWRIILHMRPENQANIPSISFLDDENGEGDKIVAVDTAGHCWIFDIWALGAPNVCLYPIGAGRPTRNPIGWGVMTLPDELFQEVDTAVQFTGLRREEIDGFKDVGGRHVLELTAGVAKIPGNAGRHLSTGLQTLRRTQIREDVPFRMPDVFSEGPEGTNSPPSQEDVKEKIRARDSRWYQLGRVFCDSQERDKLEPLKIEPGTFQPSMTIVPSSALVIQHENLRPQYLLNSVLCNISRKQYAETVYYGKVGQNCQAPRCRGLISDSIARRFSILRTTDTDVELHNLDTEKTDVLCRKLLPSMPLKRVSQLSDMQHSQMICMLHCIPELSLVVIGSCCGRVALIRMTKARNGGEFRHGFRIEWILPRTEEEEAKVKPSVWMVGMAVSRVPQPGARGIDLFPPVPSATAPTAMNDRISSRGYCKSRQHDVVPRWRLLLHFIDHTILTYTIEASPPQDDQMNINLKPEDYLITPNSTAQASKHPGPDV